LKSHFFLRQGYEYRHWTNTNKTKNTTQKNKIGILWQDRYNIHPVDLHLKLRSVLANALSILLWCTVSYYSIGIFKLFLQEFVHENRSIHHNTKPKTVKSKWTTRTTLIHIKHGVGSVECKKYLLYMCRPSCYSCYGRICLQADVTMNLEIKTARQYWM
jgi:hypothetical protein